MQVLLVRLASVVLANDANSGDAAACGNYMEACLRNKSDFVNIEVSALSPVLCAMMLAS